MANLQDKDIKTILKNTQLKEHVEKVKKMMYE